MQISGDLMILSLYVVGALFIAVFILASIDRVVFFSDRGDLFTTIGITLIPFIGTLLAAPFFNEVTEEFSAGAWVIGGITGLATMYCVVKTYLNSIKSNGVGIGIVMGTIKIVTSILLYLFIFGIFGKISDDKSGAAEKALVVALIFGIFAWVLKKLINGQRVQEKREALNVS